VDRVVVSADARGTGGGGTSQPDGARGIVRWEEEPGVRAVRGRL